jgi:hypothetical protein
MNQIGESQTKRIYYFVISSQDIVREGDVSINAPQLQSTTIGFTLLALISFNSVAVKHVQGYNSRQQLGVPGLTGSGLINVPIRRGHL